jgi:hypothetical protein
MNTLLNLTERGASKVDDTVQSCLLFFDGAPGTVAPTEGVEKR